MAFSMRIKIFEQSVQRRTMQTAYDLKQFVGATPILVQKMPTLNVVTQAGRAVCYDGWLVVPDPLFADQLLDEGEIEKRRLSPIEFEVTWRYVMVCDDTQYDTIDHHAIAKAPETPTFEDPT